MDSGLVISGGNTPTPVKANPQKPTREYFERLAGVVLFDWQWNVISAILDAEEKTFNFYPLQYRRGGGLTMVRHILSTYFNDRHQEANLQQESDVIPCGPTDDEAMCSCGCTGFNERCQLYLEFYRGESQIPPSHICCKIPGR